ncbi:MAG TPA: protein kinase [Kofleriaceae bacterium]|nr:protein kinase [Kofleriaceae bacterium]
MQQELEASVQIGQVLASKYRVDRVLGAGGMGIVVAATHLQLDQLVALKFIRREAMMIPEVVSRFEREARAAVRLKSEHVARIIDVGRLETGSPFIVMEYLEGQDLSGVLEQHGPLSVPVACDFIIQACDAIAEAHNLGIVHRDLKPGNLFLACTSHGQQTIKVLDFGISKNVAVGDPNMTRTQAVMGSPGYMSPEQMRSSKNVDGRTDVWSLGVILYELVAGRVPFQADTFTALCLKVAMDPHPPLPALPSALPPGFEAVVNRALEKNPARRYQSAVEFAQALAPFGTAQSCERAKRLGASPAAVQGSGPHPLVTATPAQSTLHAAAGQFQTRVSAGHSRLRQVALAGVGICAMAGIGIGIGMMREGHGESGTAKNPVADHQPEPEATTPTGATQPKPSAPRPPDIAPAAAETTSTSTASKMTPPTTVDPQREASTAPRVPQATDGGIDARTEPIDTHQDRDTKDARPKDKSNTTSTPFNPFGTAATPE